MSIEEETASDTRDQLVQKLKFHRRSIEQYAQRIVRLEDLVDELIKKIPDAATVEVSGYGGWRYVLPGVDMPEGSLDDDLEMGRRILDLPMGRNDAGAATVREYLVKLLAELWEHDEGFSGKRPFGYSGWKWELYQTLEDAKLTDDDDRAKNESLIHLAIKTMAEVSQ